MSLALLPQPDGFEGLVMFVEQPKGSDLPVLNGEYEGGPRAHVDPVPPRGVEADEPRSTTLRFSSSTF